MIERKPFDIETDPDTLRDVVLDPVRQYDARGLEELMAIFLDLQKRANKDSRHKLFYEGRRDILKLMLELLNLSEVVYTNQPLPDPLPTITDDQARGLSALYFGMLDLEKTGASDKYIDGARIEMLFSLEQLGQIRAAYRDENIEPNNVFPANVINTPGFRNLMEERFPDG